MFHKQSGNAVGIVVLDIAHFHIEINICDICSLEAIFDSVNEVLLHIGMQQFALLSPFSHLGLMSGCLTILPMSSRHSRHTRHWCVRWRSVSASFWASTFLHDIRADNGVCGA